MEYFFICYTLLLCCQYLDIFIDEIKIFPYYWFDIVSFFLTTASIVNWTKIGY